jgi:hypothetical protein
MKFADFLQEGYVVSTPPELPPSTQHYTSIVSTSFRDAVGDQHQIQVETVIYNRGGQITSIHPTRVKHNGRLVEYAQFLYAIPDVGNQALHNPDEHIPEWSSWLE